MDGDDIALWHSPLQPSDPEWLPNFINEKDQLMDGEYYTLLVGSFQNEQNAIKLARKLEEVSLPMPIQVSRVTTTGSRQVWYRVMVGKFYKKSIALNKANDLPCLLYTSPSPRDATLSRMPSSA